MRQACPAAIVLLLGLGGAVLADRPAPKPAGKVTPNGQNVVPITAFMEAPDFPYAPKKPSLWKRFVNALTSPFTKEAMPPGTVPTPGMLPTVGPRPPAKPPVR